MSFERCKDTAVIIPARNEAERIAACLTALAPQCNARVRVVVVDVSYTPLKLPTTYSV